MELEEGSLPGSKLVGNSENAKLGTAVELVSDPAADGATLLKFVPA